jgi:hypothetical protein
LVAARERGGKERKRERKRERERREAAPWGVEREREKPKRVFAIE